MRDTKGKDAPGTEREFWRNIDKFDALRRNDKWQEGRRYLELALSICDRATFVAQKQCRQRVLYELGKLDGRLGQYQAAITKLEEAYEADPKTDAIMRARIRGELGITYRHLNKPGDAQWNFGQQYLLAYQTSIEAEAEMCDSVGNEGIAAFSRYLLSKTQSPDEEEELLDEDLLVVATKQLEERARLALALWERLDADESSPMMIGRYRQTLKQFERFVKQNKAKCASLHREGNERLSLCYIAEADRAEGTDIARLRQKAVQTVEQPDPAKAKSLREEASRNPQGQAGLRHNVTRQRTWRTDGDAEADVAVKSLSRYFHGNAYWVNEDVESAMREWDPEEGTRGPAHAMCKQPAAEYIGYVKQMAEAGVNFESPDEQDFTPLDYAYLSDNPDARAMIDIIIEHSLRPKLKEYYGQQKPARLAFRAPRKDQAQVDREVDDEIQAIREQSMLRRCYRDVLQDAIWPKLTRRSTRPLHDIRQAYEDALIQDDKKRERFDWFHYLKYEDFRRAAELPHADLNKTVRAQRFQTSEQRATNPELFIIFFSYRWIGREWGRVGHPDSGSMLTLSQPTNSQYKRMRIAAEQYLEDRPELLHENVGIWLDYTCISQIEKDRRGKGINALPMAVAQCNVVISLVDAEYYNRAWCAVEVMLVRELLEWPHHEWQYHLLDQPGVDLVAGTLISQEKPRKELDPRTADLSNETDRPAVTFLTRQARLLGRSL